jgi:hypothetical protein
MTSFPDVLAEALARTFDAKMAAILLIYIPGSLVALILGLVVSFSVGLVVPSTRLPTGLWMGLVAGGTYLGLAHASGVQPHLVTLLEVTLIVGACLAGLRAARWLRSQFDSQQGSTT